MSVAVEFVPVATVPQRWADPVPGALPDPGAPRRERPGRPGAVAVLRPPSNPDAAPPLRLTRRGVVVLATLTGALAAALVWLAWLSAPMSQTSQRPPAHGPSVVVVEPGDTLWSIAARVAPERDPRAEVADLQARNHLAGAALVPGQQLRVR